MNSVLCYDFDKYFIIVFFSFGDFDFCLFLFKLRDFVAGADTFPPGVRELPVLVGPSPKSRIEQKYIFRSNFSQYPLRGRFLGNCLRKQKESPNVPTNACEITVPVFNLDKTVQMKIIFAFAEIAMRSYCRNNKQTIFQNMAENRKLFAKTKFRYFRHYEKLGNSTFVQAIPSCPAGATDGCPKVDTVSPRISSCKSRGKASQTSAS